MLYAHLPNLIKQNYHTSSNSDSSTESLSDDDEDNAVQLPLHIQDKLFATYQKPPRPAKPKTTCKSNQQSLSSANSSTSLASSSKKLQSKCKRLSCRVSRHYKFKWEKQLAKESSKLASVTHNESNNVKGTYHKQAKTYCDYYHDFTSDLSKPAWQNK